MSIFKVDMKYKIHDTWENDWYVCPNCGYDSIDIDFNNCPSCGEGLEFDYGEGETE